MQNGFADTAPLWLLGLLAFFSLVLAALAGMVLQKRTKLQRKEDSVEGYILSGALALLGLLVAFTFSLSLTRYDTRRAMLVNEANAIGTTWLRATLADGPQAEALRQSLKDYVDIRLRLPKAADPAQIEDQTGQAQKRVWANLKAVLPTMSPPIAATLINTTNEMFDAASSRRAENEARIPTRVLRTLWVFALVAAGIVGFAQGGADRRHLAMTAMLFLLLSLATIVILDLDRPWSGRITVSQAPMEAARAAMN
jgi:hypothetical protein